jgi:hypothetical protein
MRLSHRVAARALALAAAVPPLAAQVPPADAPRSVPAPPSLCAAFDVAAATVQELAVPAVTPPGAFTVDVVFGGKPRTLDLQLVELRAPGYRLIAAGDAGPRDLPWTPCTTFRGYVADDAGSVVAAACEGGSLRAVIRLGDGATVAVQPVRDVVPGAGPAAHVVYRAADNAALPFRCGVTATAPAPPSVQGPDGTFTCEIACEADYQFFQRNGGNATATQNDVLAVVNAVQAIYQNDLLIHYTVTAVLVRTSSAANPYTTSDPNGLLGQFRAEWNTNQGAIVRDVAHLFTGRNMSQASGGVIGIATLSSICLLSNGYGVSQSRYTTNMTQRTGLTAHELGHNWGADHCNAAPDCRIMCASLGGCSGVLTSFSPGERAQITPLRDAAPCLQVQTVVPQVSGLSPATIGGLHPAVVTVQGSGFIGATRVDLGAIALLAGQFTYVDDRTIRFAPPTGLAPGPHQVAVTNPSGTSNAMPLTCVAISPPEFDAPAAAYGGLLAVFEFGGLPAHHWYLVLDFGSATTALQGWPLLRNPLLLAAGPLSAGGLGSFTVPVPPGVLAGLTLYSQILDVDPATITLVGTSPVGSTQFFF